MLAAAFYCVSYLSVVMSAELRAKQLTRSIFICDVCTSLVAVPLAWLCTSLLGVEGAVLGMILTAILANLLFWAAYRRSGAARAPASEPAEPVRRSDLVTRSAPDLPGIDVGPPGVRVESAPLQGATR